MIISWDETFMAMTYVIAERSHDTRSKIGAVITAPDKTIRSIGYNALPRGISYRSEIMVSPEKYKWTCHAEENAILNAGRTGQSLLGCSVYVNLLPCNVCARAIVQAGISEVIVHKNSQDFYMATSDKEGSYWDEAFECTNSMFAEAGIKLRWLQYQLVRPMGLFNGKSFPTQP